MRGIRMLPDAVCSGRTGILRFSSLCMAGDSVAAGAFYERAVKAFREGEYCLNYVKALQGWASLEAQARNATRARYLYLESVRIAHKVKVTVCVGCFFLL